MQLQMHIAYALELGKLNDTYGRTFNVVVFFV